MKSFQCFLLSVFVGGFAVTSVSAAAVTVPPPHLSHSQWSTEKTQDKEFDALLKTAFELYKQKKFDEALADCTKAAGMSLKDPRPHSLAGLVYLSQWKLKSASEEFAKSISLKPDNKQIYLLKARADYFRNAKEDALAASHKALDLDPSFAEAHEMIGDVLRNDEKRRDEAVAAYRSAIKANPRLLSAYESLGCSRHTGKSRTYCLTC